MSSPPVPARRQYHRKANSCPVMVPQLGIVSFDGAYLGVPLPKEEVEDENAPWPHTDQCVYLALIST